MHNKKSSIFLILTITLISVLIANVEFLAGMALHIFLGTFGSFILNNQTYFTILTSTLGLSASTFYIYNENLKPEVNPLAIIFIILAVILTSINTFVRITNSNNSLSTAPLSLLLIIITTLILLYNFYKLVYKDITIHRSILEKEELLNNIHELKKELSPIISGEEVDIYIKTTENLRDKIQEIDKVNLGGNEIEL